MSQPALRQPRAKKFATFPEYEKAWADYAAQQAKDGWDARPEPRAPKVKAKKERQPVPSGQRRGKKKLLDAEAVRNVVSLVEAGTKPEALAKEMGVSRRTLYAALTEGGYQRKPHPLAVLHLRFGFDDARAFARAIYADAGEKNIPEAMRGEFLDTLASLGMTARELARAVRGKAKIKLGYDGVVRGSNSLEQKAAVLRLHKEGKTAGEIATETRVPEPTVGSLIRRAKQYGEASVLAPTGGRRPKITAEGVKEILRLADSGLNTVDIVKSCSSSEDSVYKTLRKAGYRIEKAGGRWLPPEGRVDSETL